MKDQNQDEVKLTRDLQNEMLASRVDNLRNELYDARLRIQELELSQQSGGDSDLRALAVTYRAAVRNGHPDAPKHLEVLLTALGA